MILRKRGCKKVSGVDLA